MKVLLRNFLSLSKDVFYSSLNRVFRRVLNRRSADLKFLLSQKSSEFVSTSLRKLRSDGWLVLDSYFDGCEAFDRVVSIFENEILSGNYNDNYECDFNHELKLRINDFRSHKDFASLIFDPTISEIITRYKGLCPGFQSSVYRTNPFDDDRGSAQFHQDQFGDFSIFIALSDVELNRGPTQYIERTHQRFLKHSSRSFIKSLLKRRPLIFPVEYYNNRLVSLSFDDQVRPLVASKGSIIMVDTSGLHRGPCWNIDPSRENLHRDVIHIAAREKGIQLVGGIEKSVYSSYPPSFYGIKNEWSLHVYMRTQELSKK